MRCTPRPAAAWVYAVTLLFVLLHGAAALEPLDIDGSGDYVVAGHLSLLRDPGRSLDVAEAAAQESRFHAVAGTPNLGITRDAVWLRLALRNPTSDRRRAYLMFQYPGADSVTLSVLRTDGSVSSLQAGDAVPVSPKLVPSRNYVFPVELAPSEELVCLLRVDSSASMTLPIRILEEQELASASQLSGVGYGLLLGGLALVLLYLLASQRREPWLVWFCCYALALGLHVALRGGYVRLALGEVGYRLTNLVSVLAIGLLFFTGAAFYRSFLDLKRTSRPLDWAMVVLQYLGLAMIPLMLFPNPVVVPVSVLVCLLGPLFSVSVAVALWLRHVPNAGLFAVGWLVPHAVSVVDFLRVHGLLPYTVIDQWLLPLSLAAALVCLGSAIVRRRASDSALARVDSLTGLANRRRFDEALVEEWSRARRHGSPLALLMVDIDDFKKYNDTRGHRAGDACLRAVASVFSLYARRAGDLAARYGGEEFSVILPNTTTTDALRLAERIRGSVADMDGHDGREGAAAPPVTVSIGVASRVPARDDLPERLVSEADAALYLAKEQGKNRVIPSGP